MFSRSLSFSCINLLMVVLLLLQQKYVLADSPESHNCTRFVPQGSHSHEGVVQFTGTSDLSSYGTANMQTGDPVVFNVSNRIGSKFRFHTCLSQTYPDPYYGTDENPGCDDTGCYMVYENQIRVVSEYGHCLTTRGFGHACNYIPNCDRVMAFHTCVYNSTYPSQLWLTYQVVNMTANFTSVRSYGPTWFALVTRPFDESQYHGAGYYPWYLTSTRGSSKTAIAFQDFYKEPDFGEMIGTVVTR